MSDTQVLSVEKAQDKGGEMKLTKWVEFEKCYREGNVRGKHVIQLPAIVSSLRKFGFKANHPLVVSLKSDGRMLILCGNRRAMGIEFIIANHPEDVSRVLKGGKVPAIVYSNLTVEEEILLRIDHGSDEDRVKLDDYSLFLAVAQLVRAGLGDSEADIARKLNLVNSKGKNAGQPNRAVIQPRVNLARLPRFVQDEFQKLWEDGKDATRVRVVDIKALYAAYREEFATFGVTGAIGPKFNEVWSKIMTPPAPVDGETVTETQKAKALTPDSAKSAAMSLSSALLRRVVLALTNQGDTPIAELDAVAFAQETDCVILAAIRSHLGNDDYATLVANATTPVASEAVAVA